MKEKIDIFADKPDVTLRYKIAVMQAKADNPDWVVQFTSKEGIVWYSLTDLDWNWVKHIFRIHPQHKPKKRVPLTMDDLPPVFWVRYIASGKWLSVLSIGHQELRLSDKSYHSMISLYESNEAEYSIDRKEVKPFWKEE